MAVAAPGARQGRAGRCGSRRRDRRASRTVHAGARRWRAAGQLVAVDPGRARGRAALGLRAGAALRRRPSRAGWLPHLLAGKRWTFWTFVIEDGRNVARNVRGKYGEPVTTESPDCRAVRLLGVGRDSTPYPRTSQCAVHPAVSPLTAPAPPPIRAAVHLAEAALAAIKCAFGLDEPQSPSAQSRTPAQG